MAAKYQLITELYRRTGVAVAKNPQAWQGFLSSACRNSPAQSRPSDIHISSVLKSQLRKLFGFERICRGCSNS